MKKNQARGRYANTLNMALAAGACMSISCLAADLSVNVTGLVTPYGWVGCSLFTSAAGFPMDNAKTKTEWVPVSGNSVTCQFKNVEPGNYAIAVAHDVNGNRKLDTNIFGVPTEQWGVSNNTRPNLRAPRFDEASFNLPTEMPNYSVDIKVAK